MKMRVFVGVLVLMLGGVAGAGAAERMEGLTHPGFHEQPEWFKNSFLDIREDVAEARAAGKRVMLYFYQDGCPYCGKLLQVNFTQKAIVDKTRANFDVIAINMWGDREVVDIQGREVTEKEFASALRVMFTPTIVFLDEQGEVALRVNGYYHPQKFLMALEYVAARLEDRLSFRDYWRQNKPPPTHGRLHEDPLFLAPPFDLVRRGSGKPLLVLFEQADCPACDELHGDIMQRPLTRELLARFDIVQLDMWADTPLTLPDGRKSTAREWARALDITYAPSFVFLEESREVFRMEAYLKAFHIQSGLDYVASGAYRREPSFQRFIEERADALREQGVKIELMK